MGDTVSGIASDVSSGGSSVFSNLAGWAQHPYQEDMDLTHWALFTGLIAALSILWAFVLHDLKGAL